MSDINNIRHLKCIACSQIVSSQRQMNKLVPSGNLLCKSFLSGNIPSCFPDFHRSLVSVSEEDFVSLNLASQGLLDNSVTEFAQPAVEIETYFANSRFRQCPQHSLSCRLICLDSECQKANQLECADCLTDKHKKCRALRQFDVRDLMDEMTPDFKDCAATFNEIWDLFKNHFGENNGTRLNFIWDVFNCICQEFRDFCFDKSQSGHWEFVFQEDRILLRNIQMQKMKSLIDLWLKEKEISCKCAGKQANYLSKEKSKFGTCLVSNGFDDKDLLKNLLELLRAEQITESVVALCEKLSIEKTCGELEQKDWHKHSLKKNNKLEKKHTSSVPLEKFTSTLLQSTVLEEEDIGFVRDLVPNTQEIELLYRASCDGFDVNTFHEKCDCKGPTIVIIRSNDSVFGGFNSLSWESPEKTCFKRASESFLFSVTMRKKYPLKSEQKGKAIYCAADMGPVFGSDLIISQFKNPSLNFARLGSTFESLDTPQSDKELFPEVYFSVDEMEVYRLTIPKIDLPRTLRSAFRDSFIIKPENYTFLGKMFPKATRLELICSSALEKFSAATFHERCDYRGSLFVVFKSCGYLVGGFADQQFDSSDNYKEANNACIFSTFTNKVYPSAENLSINAIYCSHYTGPSFGYSDLRIHDESNCGRTSSYCGESYVPGDNQNRREELLGIEEFTVETIEIYAVDIEFC